jgi:hypothetical protein
VTEDFQKPLCEMREGFFIAKKGVFFGVGKKGF